MHEVIAVPEPPNDGVFLVPFRFYGTPAFEEILAIARDAGCGVELYDDEDLSNLLPALAVALSGALLGALIVGLLWWLVG